MPFYLAAIAAPPQYVSARDRDDALLRLEHRVTRGLADAASVAEGVELALRELCEPED